MPPVHVNNPAGKNAPPRKIYLGAIMPKTCAVTINEMNVYFRVWSFSFHFCRLFAPDIESKMAKIKPDMSEGIERFKMYPLIPDPPTIIAQGNVTQKSYILLISFSFFFLLLLLSEEAAVARVIINDECFARVEEEQEE